jgi:putative transposase
MSELAENLKAIFKVRREKTARALAEKSVELYKGASPKSDLGFEAGGGDALTYPRYPGSHHYRTTIGYARRTWLKHLFKEVKRRTRVVGVFLNETSTQTLATEIVLRSSEEWALKFYLTMEPSKQSKKLNPQHSRN